MSLRKIAIQKELTGNNLQQMLFAEEVTAVKLKSLYHPDTKREETENKFKNLIRDKSKSGSVDSYVGNKTVPLLRLYKYKEAFAFVMDVMIRFEADSYVHLDWHVELYVNVMFIHNSKDLLKEGGGN